MIIVGVAIVVICAVVAYFWVDGIDYMMENHPDYKGEDFLE